MEDAFYVNGDANNEVKYEPFEEQDVKPCVTGKRQRSFGTDAFSDSEEREIRRKLDTGLSRNETMQRPGPGGSRLTYIEGWKVIHDANQIFGFNGWSSQIMQLDLRYVDEKQGRFCACVSACVRITLRDGAYREDRGGGTADNMRSKGDAILKAEKEAVTDATKRALKNFGLRLGLSLYDRQHVREMNRPQPRESNQQPSGGMHTPNANRHAPGQTHGPPRTIGTSPVTPGAGSRGTSSAQAPTTVVTPNSHGNQIAVKREQAIQRQQAFLRARAAQEKAGKADIANANTIRAQNGVSMTNPAAGGHSNTGRGAQTPARTPQVSYDGRPSSSPDAKTRPASGYALTGREGVHQASRPNSSGVADTGGMGVNHSRSGNREMADVQNGNQITGDANRVQMASNAARAGGGAFGNSLHVGMRPTGNSSGGGTSAAMRQKEIDELSRMALADF